MGGGVGTGSGMFFGVLMMLGLVLLLALGVWVIGGGVRRGDSASTSRPASGAEREPGSEARRMLDARYARGEITTEEYQERLRVLGQTD